MAELAQEQVSTQLEVSVTQTAKKPAQARNWILPLLEVGRALAEKLEA